MGSTTLENTGVWIEGVEREGGAGRRTLSFVYDGAPFAEQSMASAQDVDDAIAAAVRAQPVMAKLSAYERGQILSRAGALLSERAELFARLIVHEVGKSLRDARGEVARAIGIFQQGAEVATHIEGEVVPMDAVPGGTGRFGFVKRVPIGVIGAITPFNFPINLVCHKIVPAIAGGNTVVLKPATKGCMTAVKLAMLLGEAGLPAGALNVVPGKATVVGTKIAEDSRIRMISFTGSLPVALDIQSRVGLKKVAYELGGNAPNIVMADADVAHAATSLTRAGFAGAGQSCISAQRIYVQRKVYDAFLEEFVPRVRALVVGDPFDERTDIGAMVTEEEAARVASWIEEAVEGGAKVLCGGRREGALVAPTILADVHADMRVVCQEVFGPVVTVIPFDAYEEGIRLANQSDFGLQGAIFTRDIDTAMRAAMEIEAGGVWVNEASAYRQDNYPYGGIKNSGLGTEGIKYALEEMTHPKFIGIRYTAP